MSDHTNRNERRDAQRLATSEGVPYQQALAAVRAAYAVGGREAVLRLAPKTPTETPSPVARITTFERTEAKAAIRSAAQSPPATGEGDWEPEETFEAAAVLVPAAADGSWLKQGRSGGIDWVELCFEILAGPNQGRRVRRLVLLRRESLLRDFEGVGLSMERRGISVPELFAKLVSSVMYVEVYPPTDRQTTRVGRFTVTGQDRPLTEAQAEQYRAAISAEIREICS